MPSTLESPNLEAPTFTPSYNRTIENAVLIVLQEYEGVPLTVLDISDESNYSESAVRNALRRLYRRNVVHSRRELRYGNMVNCYWTGCLAL